MSIRLLHVAETLRGGISSYLHEILPEQVREFGAANVHLLVPESHLVDLPANLGVDVSTFDDRGSRLMSTARLYWACKKVGWKWHPTVVHAHSSFAGVAARLAFGLKLFHRPCIVYSAHGWAFDREGPKWLNTALGMAERWLAHLADVIVCISSHDEESAQRHGIDKTKLITIPNAIADVKPSTEVIEWPQGKRRFLFVGRLDRQKGVDILLDAMKLLPDDAFAYIVGGQVVSAEQTMKTHDNAVITGWISRDQVQAYIQSAEVVVVPSRWEGFGLVALEAMRSSRPVIASRVGGLKDLVIDGCTGWLVEPGSAHALAAAMSNAMATDLAPMGKTGRNLFMDSYTSSRLNQDLIMLYRSLLTPSAAPHKI
ncbi:MAG: glycosyltransferase [Pseudomonadota bacterium]